MCALCLCLWVCACMYMCIYCVSAVFVSVDFRARACVSILCVLCLSVGVRARAPASSLYVHILCVLCACVCGCARACTCMYGRICFVCATAPPVETGEHECGAGFITNVASFDEWINVTSFSELVFSFTSCYSGYLSLSSSDSFPDDHLQ